MKYEFTKAVPDEKKQRLQQFLAGHPLKKRSYKVVVYRSAGSFKHPVTTALHPEFYVCTFMKGITKLGVCQAVFVTDSTIEGFTRP